MAAYFICARQFCRLQKRIHWRIYAFRDEHMNKSIFFSQFIRPIYYRQPIKTIKIRKYQKQETRMSTTSKKPPDIRVSTSGLHYGQNTTILRSIKTFSDSLFFICGVFLLLFYLQFLVHFTRCTMDILVLLTKDIVHQEVMSTNHLGLPSLPSSAHCCANLGQHTRDPSISVPPSSSLIYCARTSISVPSAIFERENALLLRVPVPVISHFALILLSVQFVAIIRRYYALPLRVQASVPRSQVPTSKKLVVDFALPLRVLHPSNTYFALIFTSVHLASLWGATMHCFELAFCELHCYFDQQVVRSSASSHHHPQVAQVSFALTGAHKHHHHGYNSHQPLDHSLSYENSESSFERLY